jgi:hypothetical protein
MDWGEIATTVAGFGTIYVLYHEIGLNVPSKLRKIVHHPLSILLIISSTAYVTFDRNIRQSVIVMLVWYLLKGWAEGRKLI